MEHKLLTFKSDIRGKIICFAFVLAFVLVVAGVFSSCGKVETQIGESVEEYDQNWPEGLEQAIYDIVWQDMYAYSESMYIKWTSEETAAVLKRIENTDKEAYKYLIYGAIAAYEGDMEKYHVNMERLAASKKVDSIVSSRAWYNLAEIYVSKGEIAMSVNAMDEAAAIIADKNPYYYVYLGNLYGYALLDSDAGSQTAVDFLESMLDYAREKEFPRIYMVQYTLATAYDYNGNTVSATNQRIEAIKTARAEGDNYWEMNLANEIASYYSGISEYDNAEKYYLMAIEAGTRSSKSFPSDIAYTYLSMAAMEIGRGNDDKALVYLNKAYDSNLLETDGKLKEDTLTFYYYIYATYHTATGDFSTAEHFLNEAKSRYEKEVSFGFVNFDLVLELEYGNLYFEMGNYKKALEYYTLYRKSYEDKGLGKVPTVLLFNFCKCHYFLGNYADAYEYGNMAYENMAEEYADSEYAYATYLMGELEAEAKEKEIKKLTVENRRIQIILVLVVALFVLGAGASGRLIVTKKKIGRLNEQLQFLANHDDLTKIYNRRQLDKVTDAEWDTFAGHMPMAVVMTDIDFFKLYNDTYGHVDGDKALVSVANVIQNSCRESDTVIRYGGEEFLIIMPDTTKEEARALCNQILERVRDLHITHEQSSVSDVITMSMGIAVTDIMMPARVLIRNADEALYEAKKRRNCMRIYEPKNLNQPQS